MNYGPCPLIDTWHIVTIIKYLTLIECLYMRYSLSVLDVSSSDSHNPIGEILFIIPVT